MTRAEIVCLCALSIAPLILDQGLWRFDRRFFSHRTVNNLIELGLAVRANDVVRKVA